MMTPSHSDQKFVPSAEDKASQHLENQPNQVTQMSNLNTTVASATGDISAKEPTILRQIPDAKPTGFIFQSGTPITPDESRRVIEGKIFDESAIYSGVINPSFASNTVQGAPSIVELARALKNDPQLIYEFVYNNIEWEPGWGVQKGALGCLMDGMGNSFDQSLLLANLLRQAGFTSNIVLGQLEMTEAQLTPWFNVANVIDAHWYCINLNIPAVFPTFGPNKMVMSHVWVEVVISGTTYVLDPSYKTYTRKAAVANLGTILGYNAATFLNNAKVGATVDAGGDFVQNMNSTNIRSDLTTMTSNLVTYIKNNAVGSAPAGTATVDDVLGGAAIVPITLPFAWSTTLAYQKPGDVPTIWTGDVPLGYKTTLRVTYPGIDQTFTSDQLAGGRLTLWFDALLNPTLYLNGVAVQTGTQQGIGTYTFINAAVVHNAYANYNQNLGTPVSAGQPILIANAWGNLGRGQLDFHTTQLAANQAAGGAVDSEPVLGENLAITWFQWAAQNSRATDLVNRILYCKSMYNHQVGFIGFNGFGDNAINTDLGGINVSSYGLADENIKPPINNTVIAMHGVALEAAVLAQMTGLKPGLSTTTVIEKANRTAAITIGGTVTVGNVLTITVNDAALSGGTKSNNYTVIGGDTLTSIATALTTALNGDSSLSDIGVTATSSGTVILVSSTSVNQTSYASSTSGGATETITIAFSKIYKGTSANWTAGTNISANLVANGYSATDMTNLYNFYLQWGNSVVLGDRPNLKLGEFTGWGYWNYPSAGAYGIINGTYKGGGAQPGPYTFVIEPNSILGFLFQMATGDPISFGTGEFVYSNNDLSIGSGEFPYNLTFQRFYSSSNQYSQTTLGRGWSHGFDMSAKVGSEGLLAMGEQFAVQGAATIAELFICTDLLADTTRPVAKLVTASLADAWWVDQLVNNAVVVSLPQDRSVFVKQPNGTYTAPARNPSTLTLVAGLYTVTTPQKVKYNFNASGQISTIVYPSGVTITFAYTSGLLTSVTNGMGRTLTLNYTSGKLTSVSDGTGRSVGYTIDGSSNLTIFTDANGKNTTYSYDNPGRMTAYFLPAYPATAFATNVYDSLSRVKTQSNARAQVWNYYFAGARSECDDPLGNQQIAYYNNLGAATRAIDALGQETKNVYDGLNRLIQTIVPEGNQVLLTYDSNNCMLTRTQVPKSGSGLSNIVETFTYDPLWAKVQTYQDGRLNTTTFTYDAVLGNMLTIQRPVVGGFTPTVTKTWNARGQMLTETDETGVVTKYVYDGTLEKLTSKIVDFNAVGHLNLTTSFGYDSVGNVTSVTDPNTFQTTFVFDLLRRMTQKTDPAPFSYVTTLAYDDNSNLLNIQRQTGGSPAWQVYSWTYSATNKRLTAVDPFPNTTTWVYDGKDRVQSMTDAQNRLWQYGYDALDRLNLVTDPSSTICDTKTYTVNGLLASVMDARNNTTQYTYDGLDRLNKTIYADTTFEQNSSYDDCGNVLTHLTRSGSSIVRTFDVLNRPSTKSPTGQPVISYVYDLASRMTQISKPVVAGDPSSGVLTFSFDTAGRFFQEQYPDGKTVTHVLDANGNRTRTTWPDTYFVTRVFDQLNRLTDIKLNGSGTSAVIIAYNQLSQRTQLTYSNGATVVHSPQLNEDVTKIAHNFVGSSVAFTYGFNNVHEPISVAQSDISYIWHAPSAASTAYAAADNVNKYPTVGGTGYGYDGNKNLTSDGVWTYVFDTENHLLSANKTGVSASFVYDPMQRQSQKTVGSVKNRYIYSEWQRIADYDGVADTLQNRYVYGTGIDEPLIQVSSAGVLTFLHADRTGSIVATSDNTGAVTNKNRYGTFGETNSLAGTTFGYTGQRYDSELGLYYYKRRYYSFSMGRFLQTDPVRYTGEDFNLYTYVMNSPLANTDPFGLQGLGSDMNPNANPDDVKAMHEHQAMAIDTAADTAHQMAAWIGIGMTSWGWMAGFTFPQGLIVGGLSWLALLSLEQALRRRSRDLRDGTVAYGAHANSHLVMAPPNPFGGWAMISYWPPEIAAALIQPSFYWVDDVTGAPTE